ncbi:pentapeptide repeat-containing protein [Clostridium omnivorum]|uniref:Pentapeptide repeat-containing protein n=1 Tax=Clostridium omnivorum TaxID=1604902 RepID=A0ABQ5NBI8_9CLOT|nr:pentapeptide repeat-containing protein [Clostridium sp. E14]GLC32639.1 hypothetical protein bsdE14_40490 [Clostridium sp. E14]
MTYKNIIVRDKKLYEVLRINCKRCFGFCCVALYFSASEGFPTDKDAGIPCINLQEGFTCAIHKNLRENGLKGCIAYDCFGAGQKVAQVTYRGEHWLKKPELEKEMFQVFLIMRQLHEMLWYLTEALMLQGNSITKNTLSQLIKETEGLTNLDAGSLLEINLEAHRQKVNSLLQQTSEHIRFIVTSGQKNTLKSKKRIAGRLDLIGADLRRTNLRGADLRGALLIAANLSGNDLSGADLIGADLRDADIRDANLSDSLFITQSQINSARGNSNTRLPVSLTPPEYWDR